MGPWDQYASRKVSNNKPALNEPLSRTAKVTLFVVTALACLSVFRASVAESVPGISILCFPLVLALVIYMIRVRRGERED